MHSPLEELHAGLTEAFAGRKSDGAYKLLMRFVANVNALPAAAGAVLESRELDAWCQRLAEGIEPGAFDSSGASSDGETQVYLVTELYEVGGHSGVVRDFIQMQPDRQHHLLLTDIHRKTDRAVVEREFAADNVHIHWADGGGSLSDRASWVTAALQFFRTARVFLFTHHEDAVAISAVMAARHDRVFFYHHADHTLSLGMHLPGSKHLDLSSCSLENCRDHLGIESCLYVPLMSPSMEPRAPSSFTAGSDSSEFVTCSAGNGGKFERPYAYPYAEIVPRILQTTGGRHVHIGDLSKTYLERIRTALANAGLDLERFVFAGRVPDLAEAMRKYSVSLYISSFPIGGAKAAIDVMGTGTPLISHSHIYNAYLGTQCFVYPEAGIWRHPDELVDLLTGMDSARLQEQSEQARSFWEKHYAPEVLRRVLDSPDLSDTVEPPKMPDYQPDALRHVLATSGSQGDFAALFSRIATLEKQLSKARRFSEKTLTSLEKSEKRLDDQRRELSEIQSSGVWKLVRPFFKLGRSLRKRRGGS